MIRTIRFQNFKILREATLPLERFTLLVGPNGSGKSSVLEALELIKKPASLSPVRFKSIVSAGMNNETEKISFLLGWDGPASNLRTQLVLWLVRETGRVHAEFNHTNRDHLVSVKLSKFLEGISRYSFDANMIAQPFNLVPNATLGENGARLAVVLDRIRDQFPEHFRQINDELGRWLPEYDQVLFDTPGEGARAILLRTRLGGHRIPAGELSQGTLLALALLTLAYLPQPPSLVCLEEPDRGIHPRLFRNVQDALYRLAHPETHGESREPVQVIATTHSPYFLDHFKEHPEEVVIAEKADLTATFHRLSDRADLMESLSQGSLGEIWYSGILGGVPAARSPS